LIEIDKTYRDRIQLRRNLIEQHGTTVVDVNQDVPLVKEAVTELYEWLFGVYLPQRFPSMFIVISNTDNHQNSSTTDKEKNENRAERNVVWNKVTNETLPITAPSNSAEALRIMGCHIDCEFLILLPSPSPSVAHSSPNFDSNSTTVPQTPKYYLRAYVLAFPSGFNTPSKMNKRLADIHIPVPGYSEKLEKSMDRFFATLPEGKIVKRVNWSVTVSPELFADVGTTHLDVEAYDDGANPDVVLGESTWDSKRMTPEQGGEADENKHVGTNGKKQDLDISKAVLRCERQTLHRLPKTKALVFAFKTYTYPLSEVKAEGNGKALAEAIDGLSKGSVPKIAVYKSAVVWGDAVKMYLRSSER
jgi:hypothetical protein